MADFFRTLDDVVGLHDSPSQKTVSGVAENKLTLQDSTGSAVTRAAFDNAMGLTDSLAVVKSKAFSNNENITDAGSVYAKGLIGEDSVGLTDDPPIIVTGSAQAWSRTVTDNLKLRDLDLPQQTGWAAIPDDRMGLHDTQSFKTTVGAGNFTQSLEESTGLQDDDPVLSQSHVLPDDALGLSDPAPTVVKTAGVFFSRTIEDPAGLVDDDGAGDSSNFLVVTKFTPLHTPTFDDTSNLRDGLTITLTPDGFIFEGPTVEESPAGGDELFWYYGLLRGITVVQDPDTTWRMVRYPSSEELAAALKVYRGGYTYPITNAEAAALTNAGFGAFIIGTTAVTQTVPENPLVPVGATTYGSGGYGSGPYGG